MCATDTIYKKSTVEEGDNSKYYEMKKKGKKGVKRRI